MGRLDPLECLFLAQDPLLDHVHGDSDGGRRGALCGACLEHEQSPALDRELEVLDVPVVLLQAAGDPLELVVRLRQVLLELGDLLRCADPGNDVLALCVRQVLAVERLLAGVRVAGEGHARPGVVAHVPEDHRHDVHRRSEVVWDLVVLPVVARPLPEPGREDRLDGEVQLLIRVGGEFATGLAADDRLELVGDLTQGGRVEVRVLFDAPRVLGGVERLVELRAVDVHHDPAEHLDKAPVRVPPEPLVAGQGDESLERPLVQAEVEDGVHHAGHRELRA